MRFVVALAALAAANNQDMVVDTTGWDKTDHKNNEYLWNLRFNQDSKMFKIAQLSDLMTNGVAEDYLKTQSLIENIVYNVKPDLFVITGEIVDPAKGDEFENLYHNAMEFIKNSGIPWVWTGGSNVEGMSREEMLRID